MRTADEYADLAERAMSMGHADDGAIWATLAVAAATLEAVQPCTLADHGVVFGDDSYAEEAEALSLSGPQSTCDTCGAPIEHTPNGWVHEYGNEPIVPRKTHRATPYRGASGGMG